MKLQLKNDNAIELLPDGIHEVAITKYDIKQKEGGEYPYINWEMTVVEGESKGRKVWDMTSLAPSALFRLSQFVSAVQDLPEGAAIDFDTETDLPRMVGKRLAIKTYTDRVYDPQNPRTKVAKNGYFHEGYSHEVASESDLELANFL